MNKPNNKQKRQNPRWRSSPTSANTYLLQAVNYIEHFANLAVNQPLVLARVGHSRHRGQVTILTERPACPSCLGVAEQFNKRYPNIKVNIFDNNGNLIKP
ncbi:deaminase domain-containing protein [Mannheimia indoligenes]|uniref:deaminase domain-containing protein n=1 Tax=Mannheimia indoligenes TaxID=3103145 RepID=UPI002FE6BAE7